MISTKAGKTFLRNAALALAGIGAAAFIAPVRAAEPDPVYRWSTLHGRASAGLEDGAAHEARFNNPRGLARDAAGNIYLADSGNHIIRWISPDRRVSRLSGTPANPGHADLVPHSAKFRRPTGIAIDGRGFTYVADAGNFVVRKFGDPGDVGTVTTIAGQPGQKGRVDGTGPAARFENLRQIGVDASGIVYVIDGGLRRITNGVVETLLTTVEGEPIGYWDELAVDRAGNVYFTTNNGGSIRKLTPSGALTTVLRAKVSGTPQPGIPSIGGEVGPMTFSDSGDLYFAGQPSVWVAEFYLYRLTADGNLTRSSKDFRAQDNSPVFPVALVFDSKGVLCYTADSDSTVMSFENEVSAVYAGTSGFSRGPYAPYGRLSYITDLAIGANEELLVASDSTYFISNLRTGDAELHAVAKNGTIRRIYSMWPNVGSRAYSLGSSYHPAIGNVFGMKDDSSIIKKVAEVGLNYPLPRGDFHQFTELAFDQGGRLLVIDNDHRIHVRDVVGTWTVLAGMKGVREIRDGIGAGARFSDPVSLAIANNGDAYVLDFGYTNGTVDRCFVRRIEPDGSVTTVSINLAKLVVVDGRTEIVAPYRMAVTSRNEFVLVYFNNHTVTLLANGRETEIGGLKYQTGSRDGVGNAALFHFPQSVTVDSQDVIYLADAWGTTIRKAERAGTTPVITAHPQSATIRSGESVKFAVVATSAPAPTYQWLLNGVPLVGATSDTLSLGSVAPGQAGSYAVKVSNEYSSVTSEPATLTVTPNQSPGGGSGGGGGGAPSLPFLLALLGLGIARAMTSRRKQ